MEEFEIIGFDFDKTIANIHSIHKKAWEVTLEEMGFPISAKDFFVWPSSVLERYENVYTIQNCIFKNKNIQVEDVSYLFKTLVKKSGNFENLELYENFSLETKCSFLFIHLKDFNLLKILMETSLDNLRDKIYPGFESFLNYTSSLKKRNFFIVTSSSGEVVRFLLKKLDLEKHFKFILGNEDLDFREKNNPDNKERVFKCLGKTKNSEKILYVGDDEFRDFEFAKMIGASYCHIHANCENSYSAKNFEDLQKKNFMPEKNGMRQNDCHLCLSNEQHKKGISYYLSDTSFIDTQKIDDTVSIYKNILESLHNTLLLNQLVVEVYVIYADLKSFSKFISNLILMGNFRITFCINPDFSDSASIYSLIRKAKFSVNLTMKMGNQNPILFADIARPARHKKVFIRIEKCEDSHFYCEIVPQLKKIIEIYSIFMTIEGKITLNMLSVLAKIGVNQFLLDRKFFDALDLRFSSSIDYVDLVFLHSSSKRMILQMIPPSGSYMLFLRVTG